MADHKPGQKTGHTGGRTGHNTPKPRTGHTGGRTGHTTKSSPKK